MTQPTCQPDKMRRAALRRTAALLSLAAAGTGIGALSTTLPTPAVDTALAGQAISPTIEVSPNTAVVGVPTPVTVTVSGAPVADLGLITSFDVGYTPTITGVTIGAIPCIAPPAAPEFTPMEYPVPITYDCTITGTQPGVVDVEVTLGYYDGLIKLHEEVLQEEDGFTFTSPTLPPPPPPPTTAAPTTTASTTTTTEAVVSTTTTIDAAASTPTSEPSPPTATLPATGSDGGTVALGAFIASFGAAIVLTARRRNPA